ncbi:MAG: hypothetical protein COV74_06135 [Candidatus Omnitrophica bacterium CG11_big_fil_rev_8_21_14_0_20_45_26]|uniref:Response regulatory domain-containing protein n=1 Tax=Candidatus Abzuiibacterium crystallinum TaxID=1974748 RepID=A0A2H0LRH8_9BACT|nr:MAG: hypothetical protein COV74_06135 [Candidatus Omnitrophica bacterium CG11_big_fil_rev_8_21_14_0_20_45_26]PIW63203.1 MAG: hypothetical protein COW12_11325 [Candidatus Omnitrophica bacterium CG12_big_fil_rev_8_21_14_0_65_45_16]
MADMTKNILVIDDDVLVLRSVRNLLERQGFKVLAASSGDEAKNLILSNDINLIISDIRMPGQDGIALIGEIKQLIQQREMMEIPFVFITGYASEDAPIEAIKLGAKDYLLKPFDLDELLAAVRKNI